MNIYILNTVINGYLLTDILVNRLDIKGIICLDADNSASVNEYYDYEKYCKEKQIRCIKTKSYTLKNEKDQTKISGLEIDLLIVAGWQRLIPKWLIAHCKTGVIGGHGSAWGIEKGRGRSPQNWALILGEKQFYASIFWIDAGADSGEVIDTGYFEYSESDDIVSSYIKYGMLTASMIINNLRNGRIQARFGTQQPHNCKYLPKRISEDGLIDWNRPGKNIYDFVRALTKPYPGAYTVYNKTVVYIWRARYIDMETDFWNEKKAGEVVQKLPEDKLIVKCGKGFLLVDDYYADGNEIGQGVVFQSADFKQQISNIIKRHNSQYGTPVNENLLALMEYCL